MTYREPNPERARLAEQERQVAGWLRTMEATRAQRLGRSRRSAAAWLLVLAGPMVGAGVAGLVTVVLGGQERSALWLIFGLAGFVAGVGLAVRLTLRRRDGLEP